MTNKNSMKNVGPICPMLHISSNVKDHCTNQNPQTASYPTSTECNISFIVFMIFDIKTLFFSIQQCWKLIPLLIWDTGIHNYFWFLPETIGKHISWDHTLVAGFPHQWKICNINLLCPITDRQTDTEIHAKSVEIISTSVHVLRQHGKCPSINCNILCSSQEVENKEHCC